MCTNYTTYLVFLELFNCLLMRTRLTAFNCQDLWMGSLHAVDVFLPRGALYYCLVYVLVINALYM